MQFTVRAEVYADKTQASVHITGRTSGSVA